MIVTEDNMFQEKARYTTIYRYLTHSMLTRIIEMHADILKFTALRNGIMLESLCILIAPNQLKI